MLVKYRSDPSTPTTKSSSLRMTKGKNCRLIFVNYLHDLKTSRLEALAEISDFVAGLVQRVTKKPNEVKADLLNSTARLWNLEGSATGVNNICRYNYALRLS